LLADRRLLAHAKTVAVPDPQRNQTGPASSARPGLDENRHALQDAVQAEDELLVRVVRGLEHPGRDELRGSVFALAGPNGAGKTTTVRILAALAD